LRRLQPQIYFAEARSSNTFHAANSLLLLLSLWPLGCCRDWVRSTDWTANRRSFNDSCHFSSSTTTWNYWRVGPALPTPNVSSVSWAAVYIFCNAIFHPPYWVTSLFDLAVC